MADNLKELAISVIEKEAQAVNNLKPYINDEFLEILKNLSEWLPYFEIFGNTADSNMQALCNNMICAGESKRDDVSRTDPRGNIFVKLTIVPYSIQCVLYGFLIDLYCLDSCVGGIDSHKGLPTELLSVLSFHFSCLLSGLRWCTPSPAIPQS